MKKKYIGIITLILSLILLAGCGRKTVSYDEGKAKRQETSMKEAVNEEAADGRLAQKLGAEDKWEETIETESGDYITVNAKVEVPDVSDMYAQEVSQYYFREEDKKRVAEYFLEPESIEVDMEKIPTKENITAGIRICEQIIAQEEESTTPNPDPGYLNMIKNEKKRLEALVMEAPAADGLQVETSNYSENYYKGMKDDKGYTLAFETDKERNISNWHLEVVEADYDKFYPGFRNYFPEVPSEERNECTMTQEEAKKKAVQICEDLGMTEVQAVGIWDVGWRLKGGPEYENIYYGYWIRLSRTIGGVAVESSTYQSAEANDYPDTGEQKPPYKQEVVEIGITDNGIISMSCKGILSEEKTVKDIKLLDFQNIKEILKNELKEKNTDEIFNSLKLVYVKVKGEEQSGVYSYLPVWQLSIQPEGYVDNEYGYGYNFETRYILVNGIDGKRIDMKENEMLEYTYPEFYIQQYYDDPSPNLITDEAAG